MRVSEGGLEPPRPDRALGPQPSASTNSATPTEKPLEYSVGLRNVNGTGIIHPSAARGGKGKSKGGGCPGFNKGGARAGGGCAWVRKKIGEKCVYPPQFGC